MFKRVASSVIGFPIVALLLLLGNQLTIDITFAIVAIICLKEFYSAFENKNIKPMKSIGYCMAILIAFLHVIPQDYIITYSKFVMPVIITILFIKIIITQMKVNLVDMAITLFSILYITGFLTFIPLTRSLPHGKLFIWYIFFVAWGTDTFAYLVGVKFGKHKFTSISPKKSIEGSIGGIIGATAICSLYTYYLNNFQGLNINYLYIIISGIVLSILSQIGDLSASSIKRFNNVKDFGNLIPGHGGILDRIDSVIFIAPWIYLIFSFL